MKRNIIFLNLILCYSLLGAMDFESFRFVDHLLSIPAPQAPQLYDDAIIFTAPSSFRRVGISFAHEGFSKVYYFKKLMKSIDSEQETENKESVFSDSGILFHVMEQPYGLRELEYRLIMDGLWTVDPQNPLRKTSSSSGIVNSLIRLPEPSLDLGSPDMAPGTYRFRYSTEPGSSVTVAGSFNNWDPFMYELIEEAPGQYLLTLPLPAGTHHYAFFHRGERILDPNNSRRVYTSENKTASELIIQ